jgi:hypothetical protein
MELKIVVEYLWHVINIKNKLRLSKLLVLSISLIKLKLGCNLGVIRLQLCYHRVTT